MVLKNSIIFVLSVALTATACSSSPDIPDEQAQINYQSTQSEPEANKPAEEPAVEEGLPEAPGLPKATGPVAIVNGKEITAAEFNSEVERAAAVGMPPMYLANLKEQFVQKLVERHLLDSAIADAKIVVSEQEIVAKLDEVRKTYAETMNASGQKEEVTLDALLQKLKISEKELRESVSQAVAIEKVLEKRGFTAPTTEEVRKVYDENLESFTKPENVHVRHILVRVEEGADDAAWEKGRKKADQLRVDAQKKGADFAAIAREKSDGPSADKGGDLGQLTRGKTVPEFEEAAFALKKGEISKPVRSPYGWHVIKSEGKEEATPVPFEEVSEKLAAQIRGQKIKTELDAYLGELKSTATIELKTDNIN